MISILLATYNGEKYLSALLESIVNQTFINWKLVIHDDGSSDRTLSIIKYYSNKFKDKITLIDDGIQNLGAKNNFFHLLKHANSDYVMFCDQDDVWMPNKIQLSFDSLLKVQEYNKNRAILVHTDLIVVNENLEMISNSFMMYQNISINLSKFDYLFTNNVTGCTVIINKIALELIMEANNDAIMHDWWVALKIAYNDGIIYAINYPTIYYRQHAGNVFGAKSRNFNYFFRKLIKMQYFKNIYIIYRQSIHFQKMSFIKFALLKLLYTLR